MQFKSSFAENSYTPKGIAVYGKSEPVGRKEHALHVHVRPE